jgi:putative endonuclease
MYYTYIMTNRSRTLYTGVTNNLERRVLEHKSKVIPGFTQKYHIDLLVYYEEFEEIRDAIVREKKIKGLNRSKKTDLIQSCNPNWEEIKFI